jgi:tetratricopeptide (TPR) repeat protein
METCVRSMNVNEKSRFLCLPSPDLDQFLQLEQIMRQEKVNSQLKAEGKPLLNTSGCSAHMSPEMLAISEGLEDAVGSIMEFEIELVGVDKIGEFEKETWELSSVEKYELIPKYKAKGGEAYKNKDYTKSLLQYQKALELLEALESCVDVIDLKKDRMDLKRGVVNESTNTLLNLEQIEEWMIQCRLNYSACKLKLHDYRSVIIQCSRVLELDPKSEKALFRRGQAYLELGRDLDLAQKDFDKLKTIMPETEQGDLGKLMHNLAIKLKLAAEKEKKAFKGMFS